MEQNDQVQEEPVTGNSGEIKRDASKEDVDSSTQSSEKKEDKARTTEITGPSTGTSVNEEQDTNINLSEIKPEPEPVPESDPKFEPEPEPESDPKSKSEPEPVPESEPESDQKSKPEPNPEPNLEPKSETEPEADTKSKPEPEPEPEPEQKLLPKPKSKPKSESEAEPEPKPEPKPEKASEVPPKVPTPPVEEFDYTMLNREDLVNRLEVLIETQPVNEIRNDVDHIKINFYKKVKQETEQNRKKFVEEGGAIEDFQPVPDKLEEKIKDLFKKYRDMKTDFNRSLEMVKQDNLRLKYDVIEKIKELINSKESINKTFQEFRDLQKQWRLIGLVPQQNLKDLWETYNHHVEKFYDYIKINKELRDLDLKKNLEMKLLLCERAEELLLESSVVKAFQTLQKYHDRWREIGPVPVDQRTEIWERFREVTAKINKIHQQHFEDLKKTQKKNLEQKILLCEKAEEISNLILKNHRQWDEKSRELIELQKVWKTIGFAPKKENNKVYERFRNACDNFFGRKREFYAQNKENLLNNLQLKTDLCVQAESLKDSSEWKKTTEDLINLQKKWKEIGPIPKKHSDALWKRFRAACDHFFNRKSGYYENIDQTYTDNLKKKNELIKEVEEFKMGENVDENFKVLNEFQRRWSEIGFVPLKEKEKLQERFRKAVNAQFDNLDINQSKRSMLKFKNKINNIMQKPKADVKLDQERERYVSRLLQLKNDIILWENNIGFFARSKNAESMIQEVQNKIDKAKEDIVLLEQKIELIDGLDNE